ncbi:hypothetical protein ACC736_32840 [Rhizobium ruizarguesonis]
MDPVSAILGALIAGATAARAKVGSDALTVAYEGLKLILIDTYQVVSTKLLEKNPSNPAFQEAVKAELVGSDGIVNDDDVRDKVRQIRDEASKITAEQAAGAGIDLKVLRVGGNFTAERVGRIVGIDWVIGGDMRVSDVKGQSSGN